MKNLWKLFAVSAFALVPVTANAAIAFGVADATDSTVCYAKDVEDIKKCNKVEGVKTIKVLASNATDGTTAADLEVTENFTIDKNLVVADLTVNANKDVTVNGTVTAADVEVMSNGSLTVKAVDNGNADLVGLTADNVTLMKGALTVTASNASSIFSKANTAKAIEKASNAATTIKTDGGKLTVVSGEINGAITAETSNSTISVKDVKGNVTLVKASTFTADNVTGTVTAYDNAKATIKEDITGSAVANDSAKIYAKSISDSAEVNGLGALIQYASNSATITATEGIIRQDAVDSYGDTHKTVYVGGVKTISLAKDETLVIDDTNNNIPDDFAITAINGAIVKNNTDDDMTIPVNGKAIKIEANSELVVDNGTDAPVDPTEPDKPTDPDKVPDVPKTGDTVLVSSALGLVSLIGLAATVKSRKFN